MRRDHFDGTGSERAGTDAAVLDEDLILQPSDLRAGDILLYRKGQPDMVSRRIEAATGSPYTHAAIHVGDGEVAEALPPGGVRKSTVQASIAWSRCVAVLRSQCGFGQERVRRLDEFVRLVLARGRFYALGRVLGFERGSADFFERQMEIIAKDYGKVATAEEYAQRSFFCSAFVVSCYAAVGIIGDTAQVAYEPDAHSPGHLADENTFGWLLGFLIPEGGSVAADDPVLQGGKMRWRDAQELRWW